MPIVIQRKSGGIDLMRDPFGNELPDGVVDDEVEKWKQIYGADYAGHSRVEQPAVPADRTFREAWTFDGREIGHDMPKCKAIAHERRRLARAEEFKPLDIEATIPARAAAAEATRQAIRDKYDVMQAAIDSAKTVEQIKDVLK